MVMMTVMGSVMVTAVVVVVYGSVGGDVNSYYHYYSGDRFKVSTKRYFFILDITTEGRSIKLERYSL